MKGYETMRILKETSDIIHICLQNALIDSETKTLLDFLENFREELNSSVQRIPQDNLSNFFVFMDGLRATHYYHLRRSEVANFARNLSITLVYFAKWLGFDNAESLSRFKSIFSDLRKNLKKSFESDAPDYSVHERKIEELSSDVRDRIGGRLIVDTSEAELFKIWISLIEVFGGFNPLTKAKFIEWYTNEVQIPTSHKRAIREILSVPVSVGKYKNYVDFPKNNGYQSLQATMTIQFYSPVLPGLQFELQVRSRDMDKVAISGSASHKVYNQNKLMYKVISIDDPTVLLRLKKGLDDFIPLCHCRISTSGNVEVID